MKKVLSISCCMIAIVMIAMWATDADGFQFYSNATNDQGGCAQCHTGFRDNNYYSLAEDVPWNDSLHNVHLNNTTVVSSCENCHGGAGTAGRTVNIGSSLNAADGVNAIACTGCHVPEGLRAHHAVNGVTLCADCHPNDPAPLPESIVPPWYRSIINNNTGTILEPCNLCGMENLAGLTIGLDNDGNNFYDGSDPDCDCGPTGIPETVCNGVDDDCDCMIDEDYVVDSICGVGVCGPPNNTPSSCVDGVETPCITGPQDEATDVTCDGRDGDCDGSIDEDYATVPTTCGTGECAGNTGVEECQNGVIVDTCDPLAGAEECELCDPFLLDEDCDGIVNEGCNCPPGETIPCGSNVGECVFGVQTCIYICDSGSSWSECVGEVGPSAEVCDNLDNDCDGLIDEDLTRPTTCGVGECAGTGQETCSAGMWGGDTCTPGTPSAEVCDTLDNDCDGAIDENLTRPTTCGVGECAATGEETCTAGMWGGDTCIPGTPTAEVCDINNLDEDCDGMANELCGCCLEGDTRSCGTDTGECVAGFETCFVTDTDCGWSECVGDVGPSAEVCDNLDNDCDGLTDENLTRPTTCGFGECAGTGQETCSAGIWVNDTCYPGTPSAEICDNLDNDCDGAIDENLTRPTTCGVGECAGNTGIEECQSGVIVDTCDPLAGAVPEVCDINNLDEDCDGTVNEGCVDLDIARFRVSNSVKLGNEIKRTQLTVENTNGGGQDMRPATLIGVQNGVEVYNQTRMVFDFAGNGRSRFAFPSFTPTVEGDINWTVKILDDDPDVDIATASTNVK